MIGPLMEQPQYNLLAREKVEKEFALLYEQVGLGLTIFSPLKIGILTGKYNDGIPEDSRLATSQDGFTKMMNKRFGDENWKKDIEQVKKLKVKLHAFLVRLRQAYIPLFSRLRIRWAATKLPLHWLGYSRIRTSAPRSLALRKSSRYIRVSRH